MNTPIVFTRIAFLERILGFLVDDEKDLLDARLVNSSWDECLMVYSDNTWKRMSSIKKILFGSIQANIEHMIDKCILNRSDIFSLNNKFGQNVLKHATISSKYHENNKTFKKLLDSLKGNFYVLYDTVYKYEGDIFDDIISYGHEKDMKTLLYYGVTYETFIDGVNTNRINKSRENGLHNVISHYRWDLVKYFPQMINDIDVDRRTPVMWSLCVMFDSNSIFAYMDPDKSKLDNEQNEELTQNAKKTFDELVKCGANLSLELELLCQHREFSFEKIKFLIENGADPKKTASLQYTITRKDINEIKFMIECGADVNNELSATGDCVISPLCACVYTKKIEIVDILLGFGAVPKKEDLYCAMFWNRGRFPQIGEKFWAGCEWKKVVHRLLEKMDLEEMKSAKLEMKNYIIDVNGMPIRRRLGKILEEHIALREMRW